MSEPKLRATGIKGVGQHLWTKGLPSLIACLWYALPDYVPNKNRRAVAKAVLLSAATLYGAHLGREVPAGEVRLGAANPGSSGAGPSTVDPALQGLIVAIALVPLTVGAFAAERCIYRTAEGLAGHGVSHPHTKIGIVMGLLNPLTQLGIEYLQETLTAQTKA